MYKKTITYTDFDGNERTEDFYFNISKAELIEMEAGTAGGFSNMIKRMVDSHDAPTIMSSFKEFILKAYGVKSPDGKYFDKSEEISKRFEHTEAYSVLFTQLCTDANEAAKFINGIMPLTKEERAEVEKKQAELVKLPSET